MSTPSSTRMDDLASPSGSANWESRCGFLFGLLLLCIAGGTATLVGFKVKQAQISRTSELKSAFYALAGNPTKIENSSRRLPLPTGENPQRRIFVSTYQLNEWVRTAGLMRSLNELEPAAVVEALQGLSTIGSTEAFHTVRETWALLHDADLSAATLPPSSTPPRLPNNPAARRMAKRYDRTFIRDVETKLYKFLHDNGRQITGE